MTKLGVAICDWDGRADVLAKEVSETPVKRIYLCVEDRHVLYRQENIHEAIKEFTQRDIEVILDPWGVSNMFAGETVSQNDWSFEPWLKFAETTKAIGIMLDEPHQIEMLSSTIKTARELAPSKKILLAIQPEKLDDLNKYLGDQVIDELSVSTYLFGKKVSEATPESIAIFMFNMAQKMPKNASPWIQTWDIPADKWWVPQLLLFGWKSYLYGDETLINIWAWEAFKTVSSKRPGNVELTWLSLLKEINNTK